VTAAIVPTAECHLDGLYRAYEAVVRERQYLTVLVPPAKEAWLAVRRGYLARGLGQWVATHEDVLGWCDILSLPGEARAHVGMLSMGLVEKARGQGIGTRLMDAAISQAWSRGLKRIQLAVRADNTGARALYERFGFVVESVLRRDFCVDGQFFDGCAMALVRD
jgi:ribosomal protein S18 acetylase RimI-like enzyme